MSFRPGPPPRHPATAPRLRISRPEIARTRAGISGAHFGEPVWRTFGSRNLGEAFCGAKIPQRDEYGDTEPIGGLCGAARPRVKAPHAVTGCRANRDRVGERFDKRRLARK
jgi:hypothetical protein